MNPLLSEQHAARKLGISVRKLRRMVRADQVPYVELPGEEIRFDERDLAEWVANHRRGELPEAALSGAT